MAAPWHQGYTRQATTVDTEPPKHRRKRRAEQDCSRPLFLLFFFGEGGALMLDLDDPSKLLAQTHEPIITPTEPYETHGFVNNVIFPTAVLERDDRYLVYCGAADENISVIAYDKAALLATLA